MTSKEIRNVDVSHATAKSQRSFELSMIQEIAAQLAEANEIARNRDAMKAEYDPDPLSRGAAKGKQAVEPGTLDKVTSIADGQGKTSVIDAIWMGLVEKPVRKGADKAKIEIGFGEEKTEIVVTRTISATGTHNLELEYISGPRPGAPQMLLDQLFSVRRVEDMTMGELRSRYGALCLRRDEMVQAAGSPFSAERQSIEAQIEEVLRETAARLEDRDLDARFEDRDLEDLDLDVDELAAQGEEGIEIDEDGNVIAPDPTPKHYAVPVVNKGARTMTDVRGRTRAS